MPETPLPSGDALMALIGAAHRVEAQLESALNAIGLSMAKFGVLEAMMRASEPLTLTELAGKLSCVRSNITQLIDRLEADGLVQRVADPSDRRIIRAVLTPLGTERATQGAAAFAQARGELADRLPEGERASLLTALSRLV
ncbi:MAG: MarR family transcriptional regulator [Ardenticatenales bacterium]